MKLNIAVQVELIKLQFKVEDEDEEAKDHDAMIAALVNGLGQTGRRVRRW